jgi:hypothetical protein
MEIVPLPKHAHMLIHAAVTDIGRLIKPVTDLLFIFVAQPVA